MNQRRAFLVLIILAAILIIGVLSTYLLVTITKDSTTQATPPTGSSTPSAFTGKVCPAVTKNSNGSYTFSWLHVASNGYIVNADNCVVQLDGVEMGNLFLGDAGGGQKLQDIVQYKQLIPVNLVRVNFNSQWWDSNVMVPKANMHYQQWLQQYVKWQEQTGSYVELDAGPHYSEPPCGGTITYCPTENQGTKDYQQRPTSQTSQELDTNIAPAVQAWQDLTRIYANDPAIIYDVWNEPVLQNMPMFFQEMNTLINTVRAGNARSLVVVFGHGWKQIIQGQYPNYKQSNLVIDAHIYDGFNGVSPATGQQCSEPGKSTWTPQQSGYAANVAYAHQHGQAAIINEWGGCYDLPTYNKFITSFANANGIPLVYFYAGNLVSKASSQYSLNANGQLVAPIYKAALG